MDKGIQLKAKLFGGLGDTSRLTILELLIDRPLCVNDLVDKTNMSQSNISNHLKCLRECGLVTKEKKGKFAYYQISNNAVKELLIKGDSLLKSISKYIEDCENY